MLLLDQEVEQLSTAKNILKDIPSILTHSSDLQKRDALWTRKVTLEWLAGSNSMNAGVLGPRSIQPTRRP
jgi:hypothetical protein